MKQLIVIICILFYGCDYKSNVTVCNINDLNFDINGKRINSTLYGTPEISDSMFYYNVEINNKVILSKSSDCEDVSWVINGKVISNDNRINYEILKEGFVEVLLIDNFDRPIVRKYLYAPRKIRLNNNVETLATKNNIDELNLDKAIKKSNLKPLNEKLPLNYQKDYGDYTLEVENKESLKAQVISIPDEFKKQSQINSCNNSSIAGLFHQNICEIEKEISNAILSATVKIRPNKNIRLSQLKVVSLDNGYLSVIIVFPNGNYQESLEGPTNAGLKVFDLSEWNFTLLKGKTYELSIKSETPIIEDFISCESLGIIPNNEFINIDYGENKALFEFKFCH